MASTFKQLLSQTTAGTRQAERVAQDTVRKMAAGIDLAGDIGAVGASLGIGPMRVNKRRYDLLKSWVAVCIRAIAQRISGQAIYVGRMWPTATNGKQRLAVPARRNITTTMLSRMPAFAKSYVSRNRDSFEVLEQHPILDMLDNPNPAQNKHAFFLQTVVNYYLLGLSYWVYGTGDGKPELWAVPSHWITPKHDNGLFTGYDLKVSEMRDPIPLDPTHVGRFYFPDPSDLKLAISPVEMQMEAIVTDGHIQKTQAAMFENGLFPAIALKVGKNIGPDGRPVESRPMLTNRQRRTIISGIRKIWGGVANYGDPAIIDGLIEGIERLQTTPREMDFERSGDIVKRRIFQLFGVNPITVGEITASNRAQAVEAEKNLANGVINPLADGLSSVLTTLLGPLFSTGEKLVVWIEEFAPLDPELELQRWTEARRNNDVTSDEFRAHVLNLAPLDDVLDDDDMDEDDEDDLPDESPDEDDGEDIDEDAGDTSKTMRRKAREPLTRQGIADLHRSQVSTTEREVERVVARFFR